MVAVNTDLAIVTIVKIAFLTHDASLCISKADLLLGINGLAWMQRFFAGFQCCLRRFDRLQSLLLKGQVGRQFIAGPVLIGSVFLGITGWRRMNNPEDKFKLCNKRQEILKTNGHILVAGGPGSGKTTIALLKARRAVLAGLADGQSVLFLSFSNAAVRRIVDSVANLLDGDVGKRIAIRTYHSYAWDIIRAHGYLLSSKRRLQVLSAQDSDVRRAGMSKQQWQTEQEKLFYDEGLVSYDLFAPIAGAILHRCQKLRDIYSSSSPLILVDEFQDTDDAQWSMVQALSGSSSVVALGDKGQRIYEWRPGVSESRLEQFADELKATVFDFGTENNRSPTTGIARFGQALLDPEEELPSCGEVKIKYFQRHQFNLVVKLSVMLALREARKRTKGNGISVAVAGRSKNMVRFISDTLFQSQNAQKVTLAPVVHDVLIDQSQIMLAARVTAFLLEAHTHDEIHSLATTIELIADMHRSGGKPTHIKKGDRMTTWAEKVREGKVPNTQLVIAVRQLMKELTAAALSGSPTTDWVFIQKRTKARNVDDLTKVVDFVRFLRILRRGSTIEENLADLWRRQGNYNGAMQTVEDAILREQLLDSVRPQASCTVMTMHQLKGREYDAVVVIEDQFRRFLGRDEKPPYMETRRLLQMSVTRARHFAVIATPLKKSTLTVLKG